MKRKTHKALRNSNGIKKKLTKTKQKIAHSMYEVKDKISDIASYARHNPIKTIGVSALAGVIIAQIVRRRGMYRY